MNDTSKLQYSQFPQPADETEMVKLQIIKALMHLHKNDAVKGGVVSQTVDELGIENLTEKEVFVDYNLRFTVRTTLYSYLLEDETEPEILEELLGRDLTSHEVLTKNVAQLVHDHLTPGISQVGDVHLEIDLVYDPIKRDDLVEMSKETVKETPEGPTEPHNAPPLALRPSGLPVILDADADPMNRVLGMEFPLQDHTFKAAFMNGSGTVIHLYEKVGKKWRPLCDRRNAQGPNGISIQSSRDHRKWCDGCEQRFANGVLD